MPTAPLSLRSTTPTIDVYVKLAQYPVLCDRIRLRMREEIFRRGIINPQEFENEVSRIARESQKREGLTDPTIQEDEATWHKRKDAIREMHTDMYFANNLGSTLLNQIIDEVLNNQETPVVDEATELTFNPEIAPWALLFKQGEVYDALPPPEKELIKHHLEEIKVVLIKRLLSDQLPYIAVAKKVFTIQDLRWIYERLIGGGKIGGKAGGMLLAWKILTKREYELGPDISDQVTIPETFFIGSEIIYEFIYYNQLERFVNQKYLPIEQIEAQYPEILQAYMTSVFPDHVVEQLERVLHQLNGRPFVVRSSSLLEDHLAYAFAGQYESCFCANQGTYEDNLRAFQTAIKQVYASTFNPRAMALRQQNGLIDYDERMAIMVQPLVGRTYGRYFFPTATGKGLSLDESSDGDVQLSWGFADARSDTYCLVDLSNPQSAHMQLPQEQIHLLELNEDCFQSIDVNHILSDAYPLLDFVATAVSPAKYEISFQKVTRDPQFIKLMRIVLHRLQKVYHAPVVVEFGLSIKPTTHGTKYKLYLLQCHTDKSNAKISRKILHEK